MEQRAGSRSNNRQTIVLTSDVGSVGGAEGAAVYESPAAELPSSHGTHHQDIRRVPAIVLTEFGTGGPETATLCRRHPSGSSSSFSMKPTLDYSEEAAAKSFSSSFESPQRKSSLAAASLHPPVSLHDFLLSASSLRSAETRQHQPSEEETDAASEDAVASAPSAAPSAAVPTTTLPPRSRSVAAASGGAASHQPKALVDLERRLTAVEHRLRPFLQRPDVRRSPLDLIVSLEGATERLLAQRSLSGPHPQRGGGGSPTPAADSTALPAQRQQQQQLLARENGERLAALDKALDQLTSLSTKLKLERVASGPTPVEFQEALAAAELLHRLDQPVAKWAQTSAAVTSASSSANSSSASSSSASALSLLSSRLAHIAQVQSGDPKAMRARCEAIDPAADAAALDKMEREVEGLERMLRAQWDDKLDVIRALEEEILMRFEEKEVE